MFCSVYKWLISQALDSGKNVSKPVSRHLRHCSSCREFAAFCGELKEKATQEKIDFLDKADEALNKKIISSLAKDTATSEAISRKPFLRPVLAAASMALIIFSGIFMVGTLLAAWLYPKVLTVGVNDDGVYVRGYGMIYWEDIKSIKNTRMDQGANSSYVVCLFLIDPEEFYERNKISWFKRTQWKGKIPISSNSVPISLESVRDLIVRYHRASKEH